MTPKERLEYYAKFFSLTSIDEDRKKRELLRGGEKSKLGKNFVESLKEIIASEDVKEAEEQKVKDK
jgi:hypothetical protein